MGFLIDTSEFITMERKGKALAELTPTVGEQGIAVATISISELCEGVLRAEFGEPAQYEDAICCWIVGAYTSSSF